NVSIASRGPAQGYSPRRRQQAFHRARAFATPHTRRRSDDRDRLRGCADRAAETAPIAQDHRGQICYQWRMIHLPSASAACLFLPKATETTETSHPFFF